MELKTKRLILRPIGTEYLLSAHEYSSDLENTKYMVYLPKESIEETAEFLRQMEEEWKREEQTFYEFAIIKEQKHIGSIGLEWVKDVQQSCSFTMEFGWILHKNYWGQGIILEAAKELLEYGKKKLGARHFIAHCDSENVGSYRVMEKLGMQRTACYGGRKNRSSNEERKELLYELFL